MIYYQKQSKIVINIKIIFTKIFNYYSIMQLKNYNNKV